MTGKRGFGESGPLEKTQPRPSWGGWEERAKALSPFKAAGTQAPSPAQAWQGRGPRDAARATKGLLLEGQTPTPTPVLSLPCQPSPILCKREVEGVTEGHREKSSTNLVA